VVIGVTVRDDDGAQILDGDAEHVEVPREPIGRQPGVVKSRAAPPIALHRDQRREAVLGNQLLAVREVVRDIPVNILRPGHEDVDEVVHHDRDLGAIDPLEPHAPIVRRPKSISGGHETSLHPLPEREIPARRDHPHADAASMAD
jgi:hypothetical protein